VIKQEYVLGEEIMRRQVVKVIVMYINNLSVLSKTLQTTRHHLVDSLTDIILHIMCRHKHLDTSSHTRRTP
jgi:hypothetical protein